MFDNAFKLFDRQAQSRENQKDRDQNAFNNFGAGIQRAGELWQQNDQFNQTLAQQKEEFNKTHELNEITTNANANLANSQAASFDAATEAQLRQNAIQRALGEPEEVAARMRASEDLEKELKELEKQTADYEYKLLNARTPEERAAILRQAELSAINLQNAQAEYYAALAAEARARMELMGVDAPDNVQAFEALMKANAITLVGESSSITRQVIEEMMRSTNGLAQLISRDDMGNSIIRFLDPKDDASVKLNRDAMTMWLGYLDRDRRNTLTQYEMAMGENANQEHIREINAEYDRALSLIYDQFRTYHSPTPANTMEFNRMNSNYINSQAIQQLSAAGINPNNLTLPSRNFFGAETTISLQSVDNRILNDLSLSGRESQERLTTLARGAFATLDSNPGAISQIQLIREAMLLTDNNEGVQRLDQILRNAAMAHESSSSGRAMDLRRSNVGLPTTSQRLEQMLKRPQGTFDRVQSWQNPIQGSSSGQPSAGVSFNDSSRGFVDQQTIPSFIQGLLNTGVSQTPAEQPTQTQPATQSQRTTSPATSSRDASVMFAEGLSGSGISQQTPPPAQTQTPQQPSPLDQWQQAMEEFVARVKQAQPWKSETEIRNEFRQSNPRPQ